MISYCLNSDQIPIIANSIGESINSNEYLYLDINHVTLELAIKFKPLKVINLNYNGGLLDHDEKVKQNLIKYFCKTLFFCLLKLILNVNIPSKSEMLNKVSSDNLSVSLNEIKMLLSALPMKTSYVITNVNNFLAELLTNEGKGTYFKLKEDVFFTTDLSILNLNKIKSLIETYFNKTLKYDYFDTIRLRNPTIFYTKDYSAIAIVTQDSNNNNYLDKFCIDAQHQVFHLINA